jgi:hypothetical protein
MMKCLALSACCVLMIVAPASARLGETLDECVARYGPMIERRAPKVPSTSDPEVMVFSKAGITVTVEFRQGKAWHLTFRKTGLNGIEVEAIIMANAGPGLWGSPLKTRDKEYRMSDDKKRLAVINWDRKGVAGSVVIMSRDFAAANQEEKSKRVVTPEAAGSVPKGNPLPGF